MSHLVEQLRSLHADLERQILKISDELQHKAHTKKQSIHQNHRIQFYLQQIQSNAHILTSLYNDPHGTLQAQIDSLTSKYDLNDTIHLFEQEIRQLQLDAAQTPPGSARAALLERTEQKRFELPFYERIRLEEETMIKRSLLPTFTTEERYGKYVDLNENYMEYLQLRNVHGGIAMRNARSMHANGTNEAAEEEKITASEPAPTTNDSTPNEPATTDSNSSTIYNITDYTSYLKYFNRFHDIEPQKKDNDYLQYLKGLYNYYIDFFQRTQPLNDINDIMQKTQQKFERDWEEERVIGWEKFLEEHRISAQQESLPQQPNNTQKKKKARRGRKRKRPSLDTYHEIALLEVKINRMVEMITEEIDATQHYLQKKQTLTWEELQAEIQRDEELEDSIADEEKERQQKEKAEESSGKSMGGPDRSMPVWLYKRRGLNIEYVCEICGNYSYWGPTSFKRHFQEWRHQHGMKCLHIPNTKHFDGITSIKDALELWNQMQHLKQDQEFNAYEEAEIEDEQGNVYDRKTYEDLKKQGLL